MNNHFDTTRKLKFSNISLLALTFGLSAFMFIAYYDEAANVSGEPWISLLVIFDHIATAVFIFGIWHAIEKYIEGNGRTEEIKGYIDKVAVHKEEIVGYIDTAIGVHSLIEHGLSKMHAANSFKFDVRQ